MPAPQLACRAGALFLFSVVGRRLLQFNEMIGRWIAEDELCAIFKFCAKVSALASGRLDHLFHVLLRDGHVVDFLRVLHGHLDNLLFIVALHGEIAGSGTLDFFHLFYHGLSPPDRISNIIGRPHAPVNER